MDMRATARKFSLRLQLLPGGGSDARTPSCTLEACEKDCVAEVGLANVDASGSEQGKVETIRTSIVGAYTCVPDEDSAWAGSPFQASRRRLDPVVDPTIGHGEFTFARNHPDSFRNATILPKVNKTFVSRGWELWHWQATAHMYIEREEDVPIVSHR
jgi:hypothetical protein